MNKIKALIFDMDGVISDTQRIHGSVERTILSEYGIDITEKEIAFLYGGTKDGTQFTHEFKKNAVNADPYDALQKKWKLMNNLSDNDIIAIPGIIEFISLIKTDYKLAVASGTPVHFVERVLNSLQIRKEFSAIIGGDKVTEGKPNPEIFLRAAQMLDISPAQCLVIEDAPNGIKAAKNAGMKCVAITTTHESNTLKNADKIIHSYNELTFDIIQTL